MYNSLSSLVALLIYCRNSNWFLATNCCRAPAVKEGIWAQNLHLTASSSSRDGDTRTLRSNLSQVFNQKVQLKWSSTDIVQEFILNLANLSIVKKVKARLK